MAARMRPGSIGGGLIVASCVALLATGAIGASGGSVSVAQRDPGGIAATVALGLLAVGTLTLGSAGIPGLDRWTTRIGLAMLGLGVAALLATAGATTDDGLIFLYLTAGLTAWIGVILTVIGLLRTRGRPRLVAIAFLVGLIVLAAAGAIRNSLIEGGSQLEAVVEILTLAMALAGSVLILAAIAGIGLLGMRPPTSSTDPEPAAAAAD